MPIWRPCSKGRRASDPATGAEVPAGTSGRDAGRRSVPPPRSGGLKSVHGIAWYRAFLTKKPISTRRFRACRRIAGPPTVGTADRSLLTCSEFQLTKFPPLSPAYALSAENHLRALGNAHYNDTHSPQDKRHLRL